MAHIAITKVLLCGGNSPKLVFTVRLGSREGGYRVGIGIKRERPVCSHKGCQRGLSIVVRSVGLEPTHLAALDPKSNASTNSATTAARFASAKVRIIFELASDQTI